MSILYTRSFRLSLQLVRYATTICPTANDSEHTNNATSAAVKPLLPPPNTYAALIDTNNKETTEQTVVIPKYGPLDNPGPSHSPYTPARITNQINSMFIKTNQQFAKLIYTLIDLLTPDKYTSRIKFLYLFLT
ncbi:hypothetical protein HanXRQr2_Chr07g0312551 [Helianthus annuus]|uniref:Uncharacterized protein n=1 Tax=Helianthus annuus TaxID=4232 RepID=A0A9K3NH40_HELAN|nr:hypothetical protein HanXRQr2_Chr07g0312551 [Helianthus annuus]KAJ0906167.1 hypothetical protein HanPSC8_Chr07g0302401 [Helianthus annuus]